MFLSDLGSVLGYLGALGRDLGGSGRCRGRDLAPSGGDLGGGRGRDLGQLVRDLV